MLWCSVPFYSHLYFYSHNSQGIPNEVKPIRILPILVTQKNYTLTNFADHANSLSHDQIAKSEKLTPKLLWEHVKDDVILCDSSYILFLYFIDDTIIFPIQSSSPAI